MSRRKRYATATAGVGTYDSGGTVTKADEPFDLWVALTKPRNGQHKMKPAEMTFILRNLSTLVSNGVPLPKALSTLAKEDSLSKHQEVLDALRRKVEGGSTFSSALSAYPHMADKITLAQIRLGERSGTLVDTLTHLAEHRNKSRELREQVIRKLAYPVMLVVLGGGLITFLLLYVVPVFQTTYEDAKVALPFVTQVLITFGELCKRYLPWIVGGGILTIAALKQLRKKDDFASKMDRAVLRLPMFGNLLRDMSVLQVMEVLNNLMSAGFNLADALADTADSVSNRAVRKAVTDLRIAVQRGERFSRELEKHEDLFPPIVNQLVIVGESTGKLTNATFDICNHIRAEIERKTTMMVGALEPILTIGLASAIAVILLAIYLPMFDMVNTIS
ncbi:type II secretion system F family protein [Adhaeretor mobilis]|uniref:Type II secretion system protein F n=1 Tax=Adhaeretor mobilis TaxID=1930276 RepID=A0A517MWU4_9BACT|nr:type II secretion system F family protein [Adhaeretor mobilis]QDS99355.1 Type II secretion system protein F [Adhaeretor mobilis]